MRVELCNVHLMVIKWEANHVATKLGGIVCPFAAEIVYSAFGSMKVCQKFVDCREAVPEEACDTCLAESSVQAEVLAALPEYQPEQLLHQGLDEHPPSVPSAGKPIAMIRGVIYERSRSNPS